MKEAIVSMITVPFALIGGVYGVYYFGVNISVAVAVGFIALFGMAIETVMLMTIYLNLSMKNMVAAHGNSKQSITNAILREYVIKGATQRLRPFMMTVSVSLFGLFPILWGTGAGSDVMLAITIPLIGGTMSATIYVMLVTPIVFEIIKEWELNNHGAVELIDDSE